MFCSVVCKALPGQLYTNEQSFTQDILSEKTSRHIVESIAGLAGKLGIDMVVDDL
ncbi:Uncharacterised protein [Escherichia coli]|nr:hypothetical protein [Escherichia coli]CAD6114181.1 Uncharacterised protein [Escherichia coli]